MATNLRLVIDTTTIDSTEGGGSASTIANTVLGFTGGVIARTTELTDEIPFRIRVVESTVTLMLAKVQAVLDALDLIKTKGMAIHDQTSGQDVIEIDPATADGVTYTTEVKFNDVGATIEISVIANRLDANGSMGTGDWQIQRNSAGRMFVVGTLEFENLDAGLAQVALMRSGAVRPVWMPSSCRVIEDTAGTGQVSGLIAALVRGDYRPNRHVVVWEQMASHMANSAAFTNVKKASWSVKATPRAPLPIRAGNQPGLDVTISGTLEFKTEQATTYDSADPAAMSASAMHSQAVACAQAIVSEAEARSGTKITILSDIGRDVTGEDGVYQFTIEGITEGPNRVLSFNESEVYEETFRGQFTACTDGSEWEWEHAGGDERTIQHTLEIVSLIAPRSYIDPVSKTGSGWRRVYLGDSPPEPMSAGEGLPRHFKVAFRRNYKLVKAKAGGGRRDPSRDTLPKDQSPTSHAGQFG